ncbi:MAG: CBS domain-containing protein [Desulfobacterales bacterium]|nr:MAG: CBS domain-containing protein [Desulfobacterales bacterium]
MDVREVLKIKARPVHTIRSDESVAAAIRLMAAPTVRAVIITERDHPVGIFTARDVLRSHLKDRAASFAEIKLRDAMTNKLIAAQPEDEVNSVLAMMTKADVHHLPVMEANRVVALLTLSDLAQHQIAALTSELRQLNDYIRDLHSAGQD